MQRFLAKHQITRWQHPLQPRFGILQLLAFPKLKAPLKANRFQTVDEIQENTMGQLMATGRTVWGPKVLPLKGTETSLSYVQCFLYLVSSSINVSNFHISWLTYIYVSWFIYISLDIYIIPDIYISIMRIYIHTHIYILSSHSLHLHRYILALQYPCPPLLDCVETCSSSVLL